MSQQTLDATPPSGSRAVFRPPARVLAVAIPLLLVVCLAGVVFGSVSIPVSDALGYLWAQLTGGTIAAADAAEFHIVVDSRLPRVLTAVVVGAGLSVVGVVVQAMVRNALADPYVLGISSGASVGASTVVLFGVLGTLGMIALPAAAFLGALVATALVFLAARTPEGLLPTGLVLIGTSLGYGFSAVTTVLVFLAPAGDAARSVMFWLLGSLSAAGWQTLVVTSAVCAFGGAILAVMPARLDALSLGDETAASLGIDAGRFRVLLFTVSALITGVIVSSCGAIGFVGLVVPHIGRLLVGSDHRRLLTVTPVIGAVFLVSADLVARTVAAPKELPLGAITAAVGVPVFVVMMRNRSRLVPR
ncbi:iron ABC transporter permease [Williamsia sp. CHRR-6]|nr:iron ABC transporter permease [Williamsia sp. CHRR-6]